jgi:serine/threonine protein phosphatase PrpC
MNVHYCSLQGKRDDNEDAHNIDRNISNKHTEYAPINFYGISDGHGGSDVSKYLGKNMKVALMYKELNYPLSQKNQNNVKHIFKMIEENLVKSHRSGAKEVGSTCLIACHSRRDGIDYLDVMNTGDSRLVVCDKSFRAKAVTIDHKPDMPLERRRLIEDGANPERDIWKDGDITRIKDLSVSRAFGDTSNKYVTCEPDMFTEIITDKLNFMIMGCDGLWDVMSNDDAVNYVIDRCYDEKMKRRSNDEMMSMFDNGNAVNGDYNIALDLGKYAIEIGSTDNITIIVVFFDM